MRELLSFCSATNLFVMFILAVFWAEEGETVFLTFLQKYPKYLFFPGFVCLLVFVVLPKWAGMGGGSLWAYNSNSPKKPPPSSSFLWGRKPCKEVLLHFKTHILTP